MIYSRQPDGTLVLLPLNSSGKEEEEELTINSFNNVFVVECSPNENQVLSEENWIYNSSNLTDLFLNFNCTPTVIKEQLDLNKKVILKLNLPASLTNDTISRTFFGEFSDYSSFTQAIEDGYSDDTYYYYYPEDSTITFYLTAIYEGAIHTFTCYFEELLKNTYSLTANGQPDALISSETIYTIDYSQTKLITEDEINNLKYSYITVELIGSDGSNMMGAQVKIVDDDDETRVLSEFIYDGYNQGVPILAGTNYKIIVGDMPQYVTPAPASFHAVFGQSRYVTMIYNYGIRYGYRRNKNDSNPATRITYLYDAVGKTPAKMILGDTMNYGDWEDFCNSVARPVMLKYDGTVDYELDHNNQNLKLDGSASDITNTSYEGNAMVEFGNAFKWVKRYEDTQYEYVIFSNIQFDDTYHAYAHTNSSGIVQDAFYWGMFKGSYVGTRLRSMGTGAVMVSETRQTEVSRAQANGSGWYTIYKSGHDYIDDLLTLISCNDNTQTTFGRGRADTSSAASNGTLRDKPAFYGNSDGTTDVKVFWIEGYWGNVWEGMAGLILNGSSGIVTKMTPPYNFTGSGYTVTGIVPSGTSGGYINTHDMTDISGFVPKTSNGSETTYICDGMWFNTSQVDYALVSGGWDAAGRCGSRCVALDHLASASRTSVGSRPSFLSENID